MHVTECCESKLQSKDNDVGVAQKHNRQSSEHALHVVQQLFWYALHVRAVTTYALVACRNPRQAPQGK